MNQKLLTLLLFVFASCAQQKIIVGEKNFVPFENFSTVSSTSDARVPLVIDKIIDARENKLAVGEGRTGAKFPKNARIAARKNGKVFEGLFGAGPGD